MPANRDILDRKCRAHGPKTAAETRKYYGALAWLEKAEGYDRRAWIASGHVTGETARTTAVSACEAANGGRKCAAAPAVGTGFIQTYNAPSQGAAGDGNAIETTIDLARQAAMAQCTNDKVKCTLQKAYDSRVRGMFVHDFKSSASLAVDDGVAR